MDFNLFNHIFDKYKCLYNRLYGFAKHILKTVLVLYGQCFLYYYYLHINTSMMVITVYMNNIYISNIINTSKDPHRVSVIQTNHLGGTQILQFVPSKLEVHLSRGD